MTPADRPAPSQDEDMVFRPTRASELVVADGTGDVRFGETGTETFHRSDLTRISDFVQGTDILELFHDHKSGPMELSLDPNPAGGTDVVLNGALVAIVDNVMLMGADVSITQKPEAVA